MAIIAKYCGPQKLAWSMDLWPEHLRSWTNALWSPWRRLQQGRRAARFVRNSNISIGCILNLVCFYWRPLKAFLKVWVKKLKNADRAETRLASSSVTRNKKRRMDTEWIQCSNPGCGKWRSLTSGIEAANLIKRLNKNKRFGGDSNWYCSMNSWDDTTASCAAPQEPLWNCRWNLARANNGANSSF